MGIRGELFTTETFLEKRSYFFNVKETRDGDIFLQIVESKTRDGAEQDRHQIVVFEENMQDFLQGFEKSLAFIETEKQRRSEVAQERKRQKAEGKLIYRAKPRPQHQDKNRERDEWRDNRKDSGLKRTGRVRIVSKRKSESE